MDVTITADVASFVRAALPFLERDPVRNTILLTAIAQATGAKDSWFAWACDGGDVVGAALRTPPFRVALAAMDTTAAAALGEHITDAPGAVGRPDAVRAFAGDREVHVDMREVQYALTALVEPPLPPGAARPYASDDAGTYVDWMRSFVAETGVTHEEDPLRPLTRRLDSGGALWFWHRDGEPVCMVSRSAAVAGVPRIGPVFTPAEHRGRGYAAALTAHVCAEGFGAGAKACTLFADAANPTSNGVYLRLGFRPTGEIVDATFSPARRSAVS